MAIIGFNLENIIPFIALPIFLVWFGFVAAGNCIKPYTIIAIVTTILELLYIFSILTGIQVHWFLATVIINMLTCIIGNIVFSISILSLTKWDGDRMSDKTRKERYNLYQSRLNCASLMNSVFLVYNLITVVIMFFKYKELQWFYIWLLELIVVIVNMLIFTIITRNVILHSKICEE